MAKQKTVFFCQECGYESIKWMGQCPECKGWNTFVEEIIKKTKSVDRNSNIKNEPTKLSNISMEQENR